MVQFYYVKQATADLGRDTTSTARSNTAISVILGEIFKHYTIPC
jgi:hypothetical protein